MGRVRDGRPWGPRPSMRVRQPSDAQALEGRRPGVRVRRGKALAERV